MGLLDDLLAEAAALGLPETPGGHPFATAAHPPRALWLSLAAMASDMDGQDAKIQAALDFLAASGGAPKVDVFTANGTWTKPSGAKMVQIIAIGGGGGGSINWTSSGACGGAGGERIERMVPAALLPATMAVTVGAGGTGPSAAVGSSGQAVRDAGSGGNSSFGDLVVAGGGGGGQGTNFGNKWMISGGAYGRQGRLITDNATANQVTPWRFVQSNNGGNAVPVIGGYIPVPHPGAGGSVFMYPGGNWNSNTNNETGTLFGLGSPEGGGAGGGGELESSVLRGRAGGASGTGERGTGAAGAVNGNATNGTSRGGTGRAGDGGGGVATDTVVARSAGNGGLPGGGGGGIHSNTSGTLTGIWQAGSGGRGEVIVVTIF